MSLGDILGHVLICRKTVWDGIKTAPLAKLQESHVMFFVFNGYYVD